MIGDEIIDINTLRDCIVTENGDLACFDRRHKKTRLFGEKQFTPQRLTANDLDKLMAKIAADNER